MDWLLTIGAGFLIWLVGDALGPLLYPLFRAGGRLYARPHGTLVLTGTWIAAVALTAWAFTRGADSPRLAAAAAILSVPIALFATLTWRDARRAEQGRPPVQHVVPARLGPLGRIAALALTLATAASAVLLWPPQRWDDLLGWLGCASAAALSGLATVTGKVPFFVRSSLARSTSVAPGASTDRTKRSVSQNQPLQLAGVMFKVFIAVRLLEVQLQARLRAPFRKSPAVER